MAYTAIDDPSAYFKVQLYTGNGSANHAQTFADTDTDMQPDFVWIKNRDSTDSHCLFDAVRGATEVLHADGTAGEATDADTLDSFTSDGFQVDADVKVNTNTEKYVAWCWKESATAGFDIVSFTGNDTARTISHSLSAVPAVFVIKNREQDANWQVYHEKTNASPEDYGLFWDSTSATVSRDSSYFNSTAPTSSVFSVGTNSRVNDDGEGIITYLWAPVQGFSKFGSYTGNDNADGTFVYLGFRPAFVMVKKSSDTGHWLIFDSKRLGYNVDNQELYANATTVEADRSDDTIDFLSNGIKFRSTWDAANDASTFIYMAFAEAPFVNSNGVPCNAR